LNKDCRCYSCDPPRPQNATTQKRSGHPRFYALLEELADLHNRKNQDYSEPGQALGNLLAATRVGLTPFLGVAVRLQDKFSRFENLIRKGGHGAVVDEKIDDTLRDMAIYSLLAIILWEEAAKSK
jgi:hypothetical protein